MTEENVVKNEGEVHIMTFDEFMSDSKNQAEFDKRVSKAIDTARKTWEEDSAKKQAEIEATAKLSAEERAKKQLADITKERDDLKSSIAKRDMKEKGLDYIKSKGYNNMISDLVDLSNYADEDSMMKSLDDLNGKLSKAINSSVNSRTQEKGYTTKETLKQTEPKGFEFNFTPIKESE